MSNQDDDSIIGIRTFCYTRWTVHDDAIESILINYYSLCDHWEECLEAQHIASMSTLTKIRTDQSFQLMFTLVKNLAKILPSLRGRFQDIWMIVVPTAALSLRELRNVYFKALDLKE